MNELWNGLINNLQVLLALLTQIYEGNLGFAIITLSGAVRFALLPLTLWIARRAQLRQRILQALQPQLERLKARHANNPDRLARETFKLYKNNGIGFVDLKSIGGSVLQMPVMLALYSAIKKGLGVGKKFFWIRDLARPDFILGLLVAALTLIMTLVAPSLQSQTRFIMLLIPAIVTLVIVSQLSAGVGLYWAASNAVGLIQSALLHRSAIQARD